MNSEMSNFSFEGENVRFVDALPVGNDVAKVLGYADPRATIRDKVDSEYKVLVNFVEDFEGKSTAPLESQIITLKEAGIYQLVFGSKLKSAKRFQKWVFEEVLPSIRETGQYSVKQTKEDLEKQFIPAPQRGSLRDRTLKEIKEYLDLTESVYGEAYKQRLFPIVMKKYHPDFPVIEPSQEEKASLPCEALLTPSQIAEELGIFYKTGSPNPREVNRLLSELGYQEKVGGIWSATEKAKGLCDRKPVETNSKSQKDQLMWSRKIIDILKEHVIK